MAVPMTNSQSTKLAQNSDFRTSVIGSITSAAHAVVGEDPTLLGGVGSVWANKRHELAFAIINFVNDKAAIFAQACAVDDNFNKNITFDENDFIIWGGAVDGFDGALDLLVLELFDNVAGVSYADKNP